ncbi:MAG TPA: PAC2 family protein [Acidimicrobiales bacterium]|nr:PAC2 family protein [Acidimicrobiales bacterium]
MELVRWLRRPHLRRPVLVAAFEGWNDAADAASTAARYLAEASEAELVAVVDPDDYYDFTVVRPSVRLVDGVTREIVWPEPQVLAAERPEARHDVVFLQAAEPHMRWRAFTDVVTGMARELDVELVVTLGALLAEVPHSRPVRVTGTAATPELVERLGFERSRYEGPTGIVGVLHDSCARAGIPSASLWATVPHYVAKTPSPKATLALVERAASLLDLAVETVDLEIAAAAYERQITEVVADDEEVAEYVRRLEESDDEEGPIVRYDLPSADTLAQEAERFLREQNDD